MLRSGGAPGFLRCMYLLRHTAAVPSSQLAVGSDPSPTLPGLPSKTATGQTSPALNAACVSLTNVYSVASSCSVQPDSWRSLTSGSRASILVRSATGRPPSAMVIAST